MDATRRVHALEAALAEETRRTDALIRIGEAVGAGRDAAAIVKAIVEGGIELTGAEFGAYVQVIADEGGERYLPYRLPGAPAAGFERLSEADRAALFASVFSGHGPLRSDDFLAHARPGRSGQPPDAPEDPRPVRSVLATPVISPTGAVLGGLLLGHGEPGRFKPGHERIVSGVAAIGAAAMDALRLKMDSLADAEARGTEEARLAERLTFALNAGRMGSWALDVDSRAYEASVLCKANYGRRVDEDFGFDDLVGSIHPQDRDRMVAAMETAIRDGSDYDIEYRVIWPDGQIRWVHARGRADAIVPGGSAKRMAGVSLDITERRRAEERQQLMLNELNHRVKNTLAAVQSIAFQTLRTARSPAEFKDAFEARLLALSETHNLLTRENWEGASLRVVIGSELDALGGEGRAILEGPDIHLSPKAAVAMGMAIHELATNAVKYGALSVPRGLLNVDWRVRQGCLELEWRESNGPPVAPPEHRGFGSRLLERGLATELGGRVELVYREQGVACSMRLPLAALEEKD